MKLNTFTTILSFALSGIIAFVLSFYVSSENKYILGLVSFVTIAITLAGSVSLSFEYERTTTLSRITSALFLILMLLSQILFAIIDNFLLPNYVLISGGLTILYLLIVYGIYKSKH